MMFVLSSPSGVGKTTLTKKLAENNLEFVISISHTTRKPRSNEINGKDYYFVDKEKFDVLIKSNSFFEYAKIFNNSYGTLKTPVLKFLSQGKSVGQYTYRTISEYTKQCKVSGSTGSGLLDYWWALILIIAVTFFIYTQSGNRLKKIRKNK